MLKTKLYTDSVKRTEPIGEVEYDTTGIELFINNESVKLSVHNDSDDVTQLIRDLSEKRQMIIRKNKIKENLRIIKYNDPELAAKRAKEDQEFKDFILHTIEELERIKNWIIECKLQKTPKGT